MASQVQNALRRWVEAGLLTEDGAGRLREEAQAFEKASGSRIAQYVIATAAGIITLIAAATAISFIWPRLTQGSQALSIAAVGLSLLGLGVQMEGMPNRKPPAYLLQMAGLGVVHIAVVHGHNAWQTLSWMSEVVTLLGLAVSLLVVWYSVGRNSVIPAASLAFSVSFLGTALTIGFGMEFDQMVWVLDGVVLLLAAVLAHHVSRNPDATWAVNALVTSLVGSLVLIIMTALGPLDLRAQAWLPVDVWWAGLVALAVWASLRTEASYYQPWFSLVLSLLLALGVPLAAWTFANADTWMIQKMTFAHALIGAFGLWLGLQKDLRIVTYVGCAILVIAAWILAVAESGAIGAALAMAFSAAVLFWVSGRIGKDQEVVPS